MLDKKYLPNINVLYDIVQKAISKSDKNVIITKYNDLVQVVKKYISVKRPELEEYMQKLYKNNAKQKIEDGYTFQRIAIINHFFDEFKTTELYQEFPIDNYYFKYAGNFHALITSLYKNDIYIYINKNTSPPDHPKAFYMFFQELDLYELIVPNIKQTISQYLTEHNYDYHYFTWFDLQFDEVKALTGNIPLTLETFEAGCSLQSLRYGEEQLSHNECGVKNDNYYGNMLGWKKYDLVKAIAQSGLLIPKFKPHIKNVKMEYDSENNDYVVRLDGISVDNIHNNIYLERMNIYTEIANNPTSRKHEILIFTRHFKDKEQAELYTFLNSHALPWTKIGVNKPGLTNLISISNYNSGYYEMIFRRTYGTIYSLNWYNMFNRPSFINNELTIPILLYIIRTYFKTNDSRYIVNVEQAYKHILHILPQVLELKRQTPNDQQWSQLITSKYCNNII